MSERHAQAYAELRSHASWLVNRMRCQPIGREARELLDRFAMLAAQVDAECADPQGSRRAS